MRRLSNNNEHLRTRSSKHVSADTLKLIHDAFERFGGVRGKVQRSFAFAAVMFAETAAPANARNRIRDSARANGVAAVEIGKALGLTMFEGAMLQAIGHELSAREALPIVAQLERFASENLKERLFTVNLADMTCACTGRCSPAHSYKSALHVTRVVRAGRRRMRIGRRRKLKAQLRLALQPPDVGSNDDQT